MRALRPLALPHRHIPVFLVLLLSTLTSAAALAAAPPNTDVRLGRVLAPVLAGAAGRTGVHPLTTGLDAFVARAVLVDAAERGIDLQYYIWEADETGMLLMERLLRAADRGVRVRLLLDDTHTGGFDQELLAIDSHPNIEIRLFNPFAHRKLRALDYLTRFGSANRRMHNKSLTADGLVAVVGGRNIGNEYLGYAGDLSFADLDVVGIGPMVADVSGAFGRYWSSRWARPVSELVEDDGDTARRLAKLRQQLAGHAHAMANSAYAKALAGGPLAQSLRSGDLPLQWGAARVLYDPPEKMAADERSHPPLIGTQLRESVVTPQVEVLLVSPYFVPGKEGTALLGRLARQGVRVRILTNSLAATDVAPVHAGYVRYRKDLLRSGVELYELKPGGDDPSGMRWTSGSSKASLHAKTYAFDRDSIFVGSLNLDPRSLQLNTEMGVLLEIPQLASDLGRWFEQRAQHAAYRVELTKKGDLRWFTRENGRELRFDTEPGTSAWQRSVVAAMSMLPFESLL